MSAHSPGWGSPAGSSSPSTQVQVTTATWSPSESTSVGPSTVDDGLPRFQEELSEFLRTIRDQEQAVRLCISGPPGSGQGLAARVIAARAGGDRPVRRIIPADLLLSETAAALDRLRGLFAADPTGVVYLASLEDLYGDQNAVPLLATLRECLREFPGVSVVFAGDAEAVLRVHALNPELYARFTHVQVRSMSAEELVLLTEALLVEGGLHPAQGFRDDAASVLRRVRSVGNLRNARIAVRVAEIAAQQCRPGAAVLLSALDLDALRLLSASGSDGFADLEDLIGLQDVKAQVRLWVANSALTSRRERLGLQTKGMGQHMVFKGPAGTAKTTVARILGRILTETGVLSSGHLIEVQRADLVGETLEQSARRTVEVVKRALGGVLFIDEAYTLTSGGNQRDSGREIVETLLKLMEDYREEFVVIVAGYPLEMEQFLNSNPGLRSRFVRVLEFPSYDPAELIAILSFLAERRGYRVDDAVGPALEPRLSLVSQYPGFGNGRHVRNLLEAAIVRQAFRVDDSSSDEDLCTLLLEDFIDPAVGVAGR